MTVKKSNWAHWSLSVIIGQLLLLVGVFASPALGQAFQNEDPFGQTESGTAAVLRALDKITGKVSEITVPVGDQARFGTLDLFVKYCRTRPPIEPPESFAYLEVTDHGVHGKEPVAVFAGWMLASSPALNPLDHSVYDVWVISCKMSSGDAVAERR